MSDAGGIEIRMVQSEISDSDRTRFEALLAGNAQRIWQAAVKISTTRADAEDLFQETFLRAWRGIRKFRGEAEISTWLFRILINAEHDRRRKRHPPPRQAATPAGRKVDPAEALARREILDRVLTAVGRLPRRQRQSLLLRARAGLGIKEISEVMEIKPAAVKSHLAAARRKLLRQFGREVKEWGLG